jgi:hypothetical protein
MATYSVQEASTTNVVVSIEAGNPPPAVKIAASVDPAVPLEVNDKKANAAGCAAEFNCCQEGSSADFRWYFSALLFRSGEPDDETLIGLKLATKSEETPQGVPESSVDGLSAASLRVVRRLPMHFACEAGHSLVPALIGSLPVVLSGFASQAFRESIPEHTLSIKELEFRTGDMDTGNKLLSIIPIQIFITIIWLMFFFLLRGI